MSISFNQVPSNSRIPLVYAEFDSSKAVQGPVQQVYKTLLVGQKTSTGTATADQLVKITSVQQAINLFGPGSMLHLMFDSFFKNYKLGDFWAVPLADNGSGVAASGTLTVTGPASAAGTLNLYIGGQLVQVAVASGDLQNAIASAINTAIAAQTSLPVTASVSTNVVTVTAKNKGTLGNGIDLRLNYQDGEVLPAGVSVAVVAMANGATDPTITNMLSNMGEVQYNVIGFPYATTTLLNALETDLADRWGAIRQNDGLAVSFMNGSLATIGTFGDGRNSKHTCIGGVYKSPTPAFQWTAALTAVISQYGSIDPARPFQSLPLIGMLPPALADRFDLTERNSLAYEGISPVSVDESGIVHIDTLITTYQTNAAGADDISYLSVNTILTLSYLRYSYKNYFATKYPRHKLAADGTRFGAGQAIMTPKLAKAETIVLARQWEELGLVENVDAFAASLIIERNVSNPNRLDTFMAPDLVNQLTIMGTQIGFIL